MPEYPDILEIWSYTVEIWGDSRQKSPVKKWSKRFGKELSPWADLSPWGEFFISA